MEILSVVGGRGSPGLGLGSSKQKRPNRSVVKTQLACSAGWGEVQIFSALASPAAGPLDGDKMQFSSA